MLANPEVLLRATSVSDWREAIDSKGRFARSHKQIVEVLNVFGSGA
jgi:hypothetical protein